MKNKFSTSWLSSVQPRKQRKYIANAPLHIKHKFLSAHLSKALRLKYGKRNLPLRKGDDVLVMRGSFKKKKAKIVSIDLKRTRIALEGIQRTKRDGAKVNVYFHPSSLLIESLSTDDKERLSAIQRKSSTTTEVKTASEKSSKLKSVKSKEN
jgi:large subunit ribosomal protein L24